MADYTDHDGSHYDGVGTTAKEVGGFDSHRRVFLMVTDPATSTVQVLDDSGNVVATAMAPENGVPLPAGYTIKVTSTVAPWGMVWTSHGTAWSA